MNVGVITTTLGGLLSFCFSSSEPETPRLTHAPVLPKLFIVKRSTGARSDSRVMEDEARHNFVLIRPRLDALQQCLYQAGIKNSGLRALICWRSLLSISRGITAALFSLYRTALELANLLKGT